MAHRQSLQGFCVQFVSSVFDVARRCSQWRAQRPVRLNLNSSSGNSALAVQVQTLLGPVDLGRECELKSHYGQWKAASSVSMRLEGLEERRLLSSSIGLDNGVLNLSGSANDVNLISVVAADSNHLTVTVNEKNITLSTSQVKRINIVGGDQSDSIYIAPDVTIGADISGMGGADFIQGGGGDDVIHGNGGNDYINARGGHNTIYTDGGNDILVVNPSTDTWFVQGGSGKITDSRNNSVLPYRSSATTPATPSSNSGSQKPTDTNTKPTTPTNTGSSSGSNTGSQKPTDTNTKPTTPTNTGSSSTGNTGSQKPTDTNTKPTTPTNTGSSSTGNTGSQKPTDTNTKPTTPTNTGSSSTGNTGSQKPTDTNTKPTTPTNTGSDGDSNSGSSNSGGTTGGAINPSTGGTNTVPPTQNPNTPVQNNGGATPVAKITNLGTSVVAGGSIYVDGTNSSLGTGDPSTTNYQWDFGDSGSKYNQLEGFNAAHNYARPGTYTITLRVTNALGNQSVAKQQVTVTADNRRTIYIAADGNDSNSGLSPDSPIQSISRAQQLLQNDTRILFKSGQTFNVSGSGLVVGQDNVLIGSYGSGSRPLLNWLGGSSGGTAAFISLNGANDAVQGLTFDVPAAANSTDEGAPFAIQLTGTDATVINNQFLNVGYAVNGNGAPQGVLVQDNSAPLATGLKGYFVWCQGSDYTIVGNTAANSTREHIVRMEFTQRMNVSYNNFTNLDRTGQGDSSDRSKGTVIVHDNTYAWIAHNTLSDGQFQIGPLEIPGAANSTTDAERTTWTVIEGNDVENAVVEIHTGAVDTSIRNNIIHPPSGNYGVLVVGYNTEYQRGVQDVRILNNTVTTSSQFGGFLNVTGRAQGITLDNNLFVDPNYQTGAYQSALVYVTGTDLSAFSQIQGNVWQTPDTLRYANGGYFYVWPSWSDARGYLTPQQWDALPQVSNELFGDIALNGNDAPITQIAASGVKPVQGVFLDFYGNTRPSSGSWSAGAVQV